MADKFNELVDHYLNYISTSYPENEKSTEVI